MRGILLFILGLLAASALPSAAADQSTGTAPAAQEASAAAPTPDSICTATAWCRDGSTVSCSASSGTCSATDANCPTTRGYVTCNGVTTYCSAACPTQCSGVPTCSSAKQCSLYCGGPGYGVCVNGCCYCY